MVNHGEFIPVKMFDLQTSEFDAMPNVIVLLFRVA